MNSVRSQSYRETDTPAFHDVKGNLCGRLQLRLKTVEAGHQHRPPSSPTILTPLMGRDYNPLASVRLSRPMSSNQVDDDGFAITRIGSSAAKITEHVMTLEDVTAFEATAQNKKSWLKNVGSSSAIEEKNSVESYRHIERLIPISTSHENQGQYLDSDTATPCFVSDAKALSSIKHLFSTSKPRGRDSDRDKDREKEGTKEEERLQSPKAQSASKRGLNFRVAKVCTSQQAAYSIKHSTETDVRCGTRWKTALARPYIMNCSREKFRRNDIVFVTFNEPPFGCAKIIEIRQGGHECLAVIQWLYNEKEAKMAGLSSVNARKWAHKSYVLSNHFQVIPGGSLDRWSDCRVDQERYFDVSDSGTLRSLSDLQSKLNRQLSN